ncbi:hypothetical protein D3C71_1706320 [compost metagenome]
MDAYCSLCLLRCWILTDLDPMYEPGIRGKTSTTDGNLVRILDGWSRSGSRNDEFVNWWWSVTVPCCHWIIFRSGLDHGRSCKDEQGLGAECEYIRR